MNEFDNFINNLIAPKSVSAGIGTVFLSFFTGKLAPQLPSKMYKLLDNTLIRIFATAYLLYQQINKPSLSVVISIIMVLGFELLVKVFAPDTPALSELVKSTTGAETDTSLQKNKDCNCYCAHSIYFDEETKHKNNITSKSDVQLDTSRKTSPSRFQNYNTKPFFY